MMNVYQEAASLATSTLFQTLNAHGEMTKVVNECIQKGKVITPENIEEQILQIKRTHISPLADDVLAAYEKREIILLYSDVVKVPQPLPFTVVSVQGQIRTYVFLNNYGTFVDKGKISGGAYFNMPMRDLYTLMEAAHVSRSYFGYPAGLKKNLGLMRICCTIYTNMVLRILNKEYALSMEPEVYNRVSYCISIFFLETIWGSTNRDVNNSYATSNILSPNKQDLILLADQYRQKNITKIEELLAFLKEVTPRFTNLNIRYFTQCWINLYKASALFGMECLPYFIYTVQATLLGSFLVNQPIISDITKNIKNINIFYPELSKAI